MLFIIAVVTLTRTDKVIIFRNSAITHKGETLRVSNVFAVYKVNADHVSYSAM